MVESLATRTYDASEVDVLVWNGTVDQTRTDGSPALDRTATIEVSGLDRGAAYTVSVRRMDRCNGNVEPVPDGLDGVWPHESRWARLRAADRLPQEFLAPVTTCADGTATITVDLPMPGIRALRLTRS